MSPRTAVWVGTLPAVVLSVSLAAGRPPGPGSDSPPPPVAAPPVAAVPSASQPALAALERARNWLAEHQDADGKWDCDGFMKHDPEGERCDGAGHAENDVGVTGLALLAHLGAGSTAKTGRDKAIVRRGLEWLRGQQDPQTGQIGTRQGHSYMYNHGIAALALCEAHVLQGDDEWREPAQKAIGFILKSRNPYGAWRYDSPPVGDNDSSVTGWMVSALASAEDGGLEIDRQALKDALAWYDAVTDPATGRVGYDSIGSSSSRMVGMSDRYPTDRTETMTAVGLSCRFLLGQDPEQAPMMKKHADLILAALPQWHPEGLTNDVYYWYFGSLAMYQMGGRYWKAWQGAVREVFLEKQIDEGSARGSWDPDGPWGEIGGRVYSTAMGVLSLEVYMRYSRLVGVR